METDKLLDHVIEDGPLVVLARCDDDPCVEKKLGPAVGVDQADHFVATTPRVLPTRYFLAVDRMVVLIEQHARGAFVPLVVGHEQI